MFRLQINIAGEMQLDKGISRFSEGLVDYRPIWPVIDDEFRAEVKRQFDTEGESGGEAWKPLSDKGYGAWKEQHYPGTPILVREGTLRASLTNRDAPGSISRQEPKTLVMGTSVPYAIYHQKGTKDEAGKVIMPARPEIKLTKGFKRIAMGYIQEYLVERASELGFRHGLRPTEVGRISGVMAKYPGWKPAYLHPGHKKRA